MKNFSSEGKPENPEKTHMIEPLTSEVKAPVVQDPTGAPKPPCDIFTSYSTLPTQHNTLFKQQLLLINIMQTVLILTLINSRS